MQLAPAIVLIALVFGVCFLIDKGFTRLFRNAAQHKTGLSVRLSKRYGSFGLVIAIIGLLAIFTGIAGGLGLLIGGIIVMLIGIALVVYYLTFGIFYDAESFVLSTFGKRSVTYRYRDITGQRLYVLQGGGILLELHLADGNAASIQSGMEGAEDFLRHAFAAWCRQKRIDPESCEFHDPANSLWFPSVEEV